MPLDLADRLADHTELHRSDIVESLRELCAIPSISASWNHAGRVRECADLIVQRALDAGFDSARVVDTAGMPVVLARYDAAPDAPTVLVYTHYDVQPADAHQAWTRGPFEPTEIDGIVWGRGTSDDKSHVVVHLQALRALLDLGAAPAVNIIFISEGEEESGSPHFADFLAQHAEELRADVAVVSDTPGFLNGQAIICNSLRGLVLADVTLTGAGRDAHSGIFGGAIRNPAEELGRLIASLKDSSTGLVTVPGFYEDVVIPSEEMRSMVESLTFDEGRWLRTIEATETFGEVGWSTLERVWLRPTIELNSVGAGDVSVEVNTIVPSAARARLSCRLVPDQDADAVADGLRRALLDACPPGMTIDVRVRGVAGPVSLPASDPLVQNLVSVVGEVTGQHPLVVGMGGSIPPVTFLSDHGLDCLMVGIASDSDNFHSEDEHIEVARLQAGVRIVAQLWNSLPEVLEQRGLTSSPPGA